MSEDGPSSMRENAAEFERARQFLRGWRAQSASSILTSGSHEAADTPATELGKDRGRSPTADKAESYWDKRREAEIDRIKGDNKQRRHFFVFVMAATGIPVTTASWVMYKLVDSGLAHDSVVIAFFASVVAEVIGLSVILANYLFPKNGSLNRSVQENKALGEPEK